MVCHRRGPCRIAVRRSARAGAAISRAQHHHGRAISARRNDRHRRAYPHRTAQHRTRQAGGDRESRRREYVDRCASRGRCRQGWLHAVYSPARRPSRPTRICWPPSNTGSRTFAPVAMVVKVPFAFVVKKDFPAADVAAFRAYALANPSKVNNATNGPGSTVHLMGEIVARGLGVKLQHVHLSRCCAGDERHACGHRRQQCGGADQYRAKPQGGHVPRAGGLVRGAPSAIA